MEILSEVYPFKPALDYILPFFYGLRKNEPNLILSFWETRETFFLREELHWISNYCFHQGSLNQPVCIRATIFGEGLILFCCSELLLSTAVVHTVMCKGVNIFIMFVKFILYNCRSKLLFCDIWDIMF